VFGGTGHVGGVIPIRKKWNTVMAEVCTLQPIRWVRTRALQIALCLDASASGVPDSLAKPGWCRNEGIDYQPLSKVDAPVHGERETESARSRTSPPSRILVPEHSNRRRPLVREKNVTTNQRHCADVYGGFLVRGVGGSTRKRRIFHGCTSSINGGLRESCPTREGRFE